MKRIYHSVARQQLGSFTAAAGPSSTIVRALPRCLGAGGAFVTTTTIVVVPCWDCLGVPDFAVGWACAGGQADLATIVAVA